MNLALSTRTRLLGLAHAETLNSALAERYCQVSNEQTESSAVFDFNFDMDAKTDGDFCPNVTCVNTNAPFSSLANIEKSLIGFGDITIQPEDATVAFLLDQIPILASG